MPAKKTDDAILEEWQAAQAALAAARQLPVGAERVEALKKAGQLRYDADRKRTHQADRASKPDASER
jgi:hypothetical protein